METPPGRLLLRAVMHPTGHAFLFDKIFAAYCMKMKEIGPRRRVVRFKRPGILECFDEHLLVDQD